MNIAILGAGAWGTSLATTLAPRQSVVLWMRDPSAVDALAAHHENTRYLPGVPLDPALQLTANLADAVAHARDGVLMIATPISGLRPLLQALKDLEPRNLVWLCKGFEQASALLPHQIVQQVLGANLPMGALSGPSFALEVAQGLPCALTIGSADPALRSKVVTAVHGAHIRVYGSDDLIGVEVGGAVKNILAIATGIADGLGLGLNARAALITRGLAEITRLGTALGGHSETFMGLTGLGDLILTCTGDLSRNRQVGLGLAAGRSLDDITAELGHVAEGVRCVAAVRQIATEHHVAMPIVDAVARVLFERVTPQQAIHALLSREARDEAIS
ncbi:MAG: NAD(P)H-dependent glycerol-3-phosphate dehydrogenase [Burkholderiaceae bacterium]